MHRGLLVVLLTALFSCGGGGSNAPEPNIPPPVSLRTDLKNSYFGAPLSEVVDHTTMHFATDWYDLDFQTQQVVEAHNAGMPVMLDVANQIGLPVDPEGTRGRIRARFEQLRGLGVLGSIIALYFDEPDLNNRVSAEGVRAVNKVLREVSAEFGISPKLATFYTKGHTYPGIETYDWVGFDHFEEGARIFTNGDYEKLQAAIRATNKDIKIMLAVSCVDPWQTDPTQFFNKAQQDSQVVAIMVFAWPSGNEAGHASGWGAGCRANGKTSAYKAMGMRIKTGK